MTMNYDTWLESPYYDSDSEDYEARRDELINEYMTENTKDFCLDTLCDALAEISKDNFNIIEEQYDKKQFEDFGRKIYCLYLEKLESYASRYAENNL